MIPRHLKSWLPLWAASLEQTMCGFAHGAFAGWYPYPFIDVLKHGYGRVLLNSAGLILAFLAIDLVLVALDRLIKQSQNKAAP